MSNKQTITVSLESAVSSKNNREYQYISIKATDTEIDRIFIKPTEKSYFTSLLGTYSKEEKMAL